MLSQCVGSAERMVASMKSNSISANHCFDEQEYIDYTPAYTFQEYNKKLQKYYRSMLKDFIEIRSNYSKAIREWEKTHFNKYAKMLPQVPAYRKLWEFFGTTISGTAEYVSEIDNSSGKLQSLLKSIPDEDEKETLKSKMAKIEDGVIKIKAELDQLINEGEKLQKKVNGLDKKSTNNDAKCLPIRPRSDANHDKITIDAKITRHQTLLDNEKRKCREELEELFKEFQNDEIQRYNMLKEKSERFVKLLSIKSTSFITASTNCDPEIEFKKWKEEHFLQYTKQPSRSTSHKYKVVEVE